MKITKSIFKTSVEFTPEEIEKLTFSKLGALSLIQEAIGTIWLFIKKIN